MQLVAVSAELVVEGEQDGVGAFRGRVIAIALDDVAAPGAEGPAPTSTWLLVADDQRPGPLWVSQTAVRAQRLGR